MRMRNKVRGRNYDAVLWTVRTVPDADDAYLVSRSLPDKAGRNALATGFYPEGATIEINYGKLAGHYVVRKQALVNLSTGEIIQCFVDVSRYQYRTREWLENRPMPNP